MVDVVEVGVERGGSQLLLVGGGGGSGVDGCAGGAGDVREGGFLGELVDLIRKRDGGDVSARYNCGQQDRQEER